MQWIEVIGVRSTGTHLEVLESKLQSLLDEIEKGSQAHSVKVYRRVSIESDLCVHLFHDSKRAEINGSRLGLCLAAGLKAFGLVHHSIWTEIPGRHV